VGSVFQDPEHQFLTGSVRDEVMLGPRRIGLGEAEAAARADELLASARLAHLGEANPFTLSGGEKRRLSVATALATRPRVLILDEPTFGQDDDDVADLTDRLRGLRDQGTALCVVTHDDRFVSSLADRRLILGEPG
jgi:energy-coupling factor transport system ATP-binding protein